MGNEVIVLYVLTMLSFAITFGLTLRLIFKIVSEQNTEFVSQSYNTKESTLISYDANSVSNGIVFPFNETLIPKRKFSFECEEVSSEFKYKEVETVLARHHGKIMKQQPKAS